MTPGAGFARDTAVLAGGLVAAQLVLLAALPLWSRLYGPEQFAALGVWLAVSSVVSTLLLLRYESAVVIAADDAQARALVRLGLLLALGGGAVLALAASMLPAAWRAPLGLGPLGDWLPVAVIGGALAALQAGGLAWLNRRRAYARTSAARVLAAAGAAVVGSGLGMAGVGAGLLLAQLAGALLALSSLAWSLTPHSGVRAAARAHAAAPRHLWPASLLDTLTQQLPLLLTASWFGVELAGQFSLAWRAVALPALLLAGAAGSVFYQRFAARLAGGQDDAAVRRDARQMLARVWGGFAVLGVVPAAALMAFGEPLFGWLFGAPWAEAGRLAGLLAPMLLAMLISAPTSGALIVLGLQRHAIRFGLAMLLYRPLAFGAGMLAGSLPLALGTWAAFEILAILLYNRLLLRQLTGAPPAPALASRA